MYCHWSNWQETVPSLNNKFTSNNNNNNNNNNEHLITRILSTLSIMMINDDDDDDDDYDDGYSIFNNINIAPILKRLQALTRCMKNKRT